MKVGVLHEDQKIGDRPFMAVSKSVAESWCRKLTHERVSKHMIRKLRIRPTSAIMAERSGTYIPDHIPPMEVSNHKFRWPTSPQWMEEHAAASNGLKRRARLMRLALGFDRSK